MKYKCYRSNTNGETYYWYFKDKSTNIYGNMNGMSFAIKESKYLDRVADVVLCSITESVAHVIYKQNTHIYCTRDSYYDVEA